MKYFDCFVGWSLQVDEGGDAFNFISLEKLFRADQQGNEEQSPLFFFS